MYVLANTTNLEHVLQGATSRPDGASHPDKRPNADGTTCEQPQQPVRATQLTPVRPDPTAVPPTLVPTVVIVPTATAFGITPIPTLVPDVVPATPTPKPTVAPTAVPTIDIPEEWIVPQDTTPPPCGTVKTGVACGTK